MKRVTNRVYGLIAAVAIGLSATTAVAAPVTASLSWEAPTTRVDETPLSSDEIAGYRIYHAVGGEVNDDPDSAHIVVTGETTQVVSIDLVPRAEPYTLSFGVRAVDTGGNASPLSNIASVNVVVRSTAAPSAPTSVRFEIDCEAGCVITVVD